MRWKLENSSQRLLSAFVALLFATMCAAAQSQTGSATLEFSETHYTVRPNARTADITLRRTGNTNTAVSVDFTAADETAVAGIHYAARTGPINFASGQVQ